MISFDVECSNGHVFEGWFDNLEAFEKQNANGMVTCPYCNDSNVRRLISPVALKRSVPNGEREQDKPDRIDYQRLAREIVNYIKKNSEDVGAGFAAEALKMHYGVTEKRNIRGSATVDEEKILKEEGIDFFKIPIPKTDDDDQN